MTTSRDVARVAGVSQATVSRVLHKHPKVRPQTRVRVLKVLKEMNYSPDGLARAMITRRTNTIGVVVEDITNPFYPEIVDALCREMARMRQRVMLWNSGKAGELGATEAIRERLVDGVVFTTATHESTVLREAVQTGAAVVLVNRYVEGIECDCVTTDNIKGSRLIADYFVQWGHERVAFIAGIPEASTSIEREAGFTDALEDRGLNLQEDMRELGGFSLEGSYNAMLRLLALSRPPTAVFCANDNMAVGALNACVDSGVKVPEDIWIVGFDDTRMASWGALSLTTVSQPMHEMVREAAHLLLGRIDDPLRAPQRLRLGGSELIVRGTTAYKDYPRPR